MIAFPHTRDSLHALMRAHDFDREQVAKALDVPQWQASELIGAVENEPLPPDTPIEDLDLSVRAYNALRIGGCQTIADVALVGDRLPSLKHMNDHATHCVLMLLASHGYTFRPIALPGPARERTAPVHRQTPPGDSLTR